MMWQHWKNRERAKQIAINERILRGPIKPSQFTVEIEMYTAQVEAYQAVCKAMATKIQAVKLARYALETK